MQQKETQIGRDIADLAAEFADMQQDAPRLLTDEEVNAVFGGLSKGGVKENWQQ